MIEKNYIYPYKFMLECGKPLDGINIRYHISTEILTTADRERKETDLGNRISKKVIWICHALTANSNPEEWWDTLVGKGKFFDTDKYIIICANILGSCYGSTGPASKEAYKEGRCIPSGAEPMLINFPVVSVRDLVKAHELLRVHLGIDKIDLLIGGSNGGFQAIEWAVSNPRIIGNLCLIATNAIVSAWCTAFNQSQRLSMLADESFKESGNENGGKAGLAAARSIALLSYRSYLGYMQAQDEEKLNKDFFMAQKAVSYQNYQGKKLVDRFNAYSYYALSLNVDTHNVGRGRGGVEAALKKITANTLCIAIDSDILFPVSEMSRIAASVPNCSLEIISSLYGHDGFLLEYRQISDSIKKHIKL